MDQREIQRAVEKALEEERRKQAWNRSLERDRQRAVEEEMRRKERRLAEQERRIGRSVRKMEEMGKNAQREKCRTQDTYDDMPRKKKRGILWLFGTILKFYFYLIFAGFVARFVMIILE